MQDLVVSVKFKLLWRSLIWLLCLLSACNRTYYRRTADRDTQAILAEKGCATTWNLLPDFSIQPDQRSRFYDPTCPTDPNLPIPAPRIHDYSMPILATPAAPQRQLASSEGESNSTSHARPGQDRAADQISLSDPSSSKNLESDHLRSGLRPLAPASDEVQSLVLVSPGHSHRTPPRSGIFDLNHSAVVPASVVSAAPQINQQIPPTVAEDLPRPDPAEASQDVELSAMRIAPIPPTAWESLPSTCLRRMLEFGSVREEFERSFDRTVSIDLLDPAPRLTLENILELALINSRDYQTRKEVLYRVALRLTIQRFDYQLKFFSRGNGSAANYTHNRSDGITVNTLGVPTGIGIEKSLYTAGDLAARFANDVVLTFNGPAGFDSSVSSQLLFELSQPLIQRDIRFEALTQAERDVVYAARDFVRFRKILFRDLASQYYNLLLSYRNIAIDAQDYFSNLRGFYRSEAELKLTGRVPRFQVDQFEQNALRSRSNIVNSCNGLEGSLDQLKFRVGLPTEMPLNVDLSELENLTLRDEATVAAELVRRSLDNILAEQSRETGNVEAVLSQTAELARRVLTLRQLQQRLSPAADHAQAELLENSRLINQLNAEEALSLVKQSRAVLADDLQHRQDELVLIFFHRQELIESIVRALRLRTQQLRTTDKSDPGAAEKLDVMSASLLEKSSALATAMAQANSNRQFDRQAELERQSRDLLVLVEQSQVVADEIFRAEKVAMAASPAELKQLFAEVLRTSTNIINSDVGGLVPVEVDMDQAMLTALVQRLDLMNRRAALADAWRQIKYAGDDLRSILNVRASQAIRTRSGIDDPFDFTFDNSTTQLALQFDAPLNRRVERNRFRTTLIDYNVALRSIIEAEDSIKLAIRNDIRQLELDQNQYSIAIASAALAYDRVISTREQLRIGYGNITARDFLEAQQAYTSSLSAVARQHIGYILDRIQLFLDEEQLQVDELGFWPELRNEQFPIIPNHDFPGTVPCPYDRLPAGPWYSNCLLRMVRVPSGQAASLAPANASEPIKVPHHAATRQ